MARPTCPTHVALVLALVLLAPIGLAATAETTGKIELPPTSEGEPNGIVGAAAIYHNGVSYVFGGRMRDGGVFSDAIYKYDHATGRSERVATFPPVQNGVPSGRYEGAVAMVGGKIYYFGGAAQIPVILPERTEPTPVPTSIKDILEFDPATNNIRKLSLELPYSAWGLAAVTYGSRIYVFGGFSFNIPANEYGRHSDVLAFSPTEGLGGTPLIRTLGSTLPLEIQDAAPALVSNRIYLFGGLADHTNTTDANKCPTQRYTDENGEEKEAQTRACETDAIITFDPEQERVLGITARLPYKPQWAAAAAVRGKAYVMGGKIANGAASAAILEFNPQNMGSPTRILTPTLPQGLIAPAASTDGQLIYLFGGRGENVFSGTPNVVTVNPGITPPWAPRAPLAQKSGNVITVSWEPPAYNGDSPITAYRIYRSVSGEEERLLGELTELRYEDRDVQPSVEYTYRITAVNAAGESRTAARAALTSEAVAPGVVRAFEVFSGNNEVLLRWSPPATTGGSNLTGYRVYKNESDVPVRSLPPGTLEWKDTEVANGVAYRYQVAAVNAKGEGERSPSRIATPVAVPPAPYLAGVTPEPTGVVVTWDAPAVAVRSYVVLRGTDPAQLQPIANLSGDASSYVDAAAQRGQTYYYSVAAANDVGQSPPSNVASISLVSKPGAPQNLIAAPGAGEIRLTWQPPLDTGEADPATLTYYVSRDGRIIATDVKGVTYVDRTTLPGRNYTYTVTSFNGLEGEASAPARAAARAVVNQPPVAVVAALTSIVLPGEPAQVDGSQSSDPDGTIARYVFDFGDQTPVVDSPTATVSHTYAKNGTYTITMYVVDNRGGESQPSTASVQVGQPVSSDRVTNTDLNETPRWNTEQPGTKTPKLLPAPGLLPVLALAALAAVLLRRRRDGA